jgi:hypothetical protein
MRCAALLADLSRRGASTVRDGTGLIAEVYPAASLLGWGLAHRGYKRPPNREALGRLVDGLMTAAPWLDLGPHEAVCRRSDDAFDAVVAALTARAVALGLTTVPAPGQAEAARTEGWIALPDAPLAALAPGNPGRG